MHGYLDLHRMSESETFLFMGNKMKARIEAMGYCVDLEKSLYVPDCSRNLVSVSSWIF